MHAYTNCHYMKGKQLKTICLYKPHRDIEDDYHVI